MADGTRISVEELEERRRRIFDDARPEAVERQHSQGKLTARERLELLMDPGSMVEVGGLVTPDSPAVDPETAPADGVVAALGTIDGRPASVFSTDFTVIGGSLGDAGMEKIVAMAENSLRRGMPLVMLVDGGGHRVQEMDARPYAFGGDLSPFWRQALLSGWTPQVAAVMGPAFAGAALFTSFADFVPIVEGTSSVGIAGRQLVKSATGEELTTQELGGSATQMKNGNVDLECADDAACIGAVKEFLSFMPANSGAEPPRVETDDPWDRESPELRDVVPERRSRAYDVMKVIREVVDEGHVLELQPAYARNLVTALARLDGRPVGVIANQPKFYGGVIDAPACEKVTRFVEMCDAYGLPMVSFIDVPGVLIGPTAERQRLVRHSARPLMALAHATVPLFTVVMRKAYGAGYLAMGGGHSGVDGSLIWPSAEMSSMGIEGAVDIVFRREVEAAEDPEAHRAELIERFYAKSTPLRAASGFGIDDVIDPAKTRGKLIGMMRVNGGRRSKTGPPKLHPVSAA
jgi:propionyl-CoA carboxylase beta chain/acetyl-CoA/propionyl-CoA carboxylase carboxyl transferase subunit